jgi:hypothetical protein
MKMNALRSSEMSVTTYLSTQRSIRGYLSIHQHRCENLKCWIKTAFEIPVNQIAFGVKSLICLLITLFTPFKVESRSKCRHDKELELLILREINFSKMLQKSVMKLRDESLTSGWKLNIILLRVWKKRIPSTDPFNKISTLFFLHLHV